MSDNAILSTTLQVQMSIKFTITITRSTDAQVCIIIADDVVVIYYFN